MNLLDYELNTVTAEVLVRLAEMRPHHAEPPSWVTVLECPSELQSFFWTLFKVQLYLKVAGEVGLSQASAAFSNPPVRL